MIGFDFKLLVFEEGIKKGNKLHRKSFFVYFIFNFRFSNRFDQKIIVFSTLFVIKQSVSLNQHLDRSFFRLMFKDAVVVDFFEKVGVLVIRKIVFI